MKQAAICFLLLLISFFNGHTQKKDSLFVDSLHRIAYKKALDSNNVNAFLQLQRYYFNLGQYDSALTYCLQSLPLAKQLNDKKKTLRITYNAGMSYTNLARYDSATKYLDESELLSRETGDTMVMIHSLNAKALLCYFQTNYGQAVEHLTKTAAIIENSDNPIYENLLPQVYGNIGRNLIAEKQIEKGITYTKKALLFKNYPDENRLSTTYQLDLCDAYIKINVLPTAKLHLDTAIYQNSTMQNNVIANLVFNTAGYYYKTVGDYEKALGYYLQSYQLAEKSNNEYLKAQPGNNIASMYLLLNNLPAAEKYATETIVIAKKYKNYAVTTTLYSILKKVALQKKQYEKALLFSESEMIYKDSASTQETKKNILNLEAKYQNEKKEKEIVDLTLTNTKKEIAVEERNRLLLFGGIGAIALLSILGLLYRNSSQKRSIAEKDKLLKDEQIKFLERQQQIVSLQSMINGQETERTRIAKDLHDGLGGLFSTVKMHYSTLQSDTPELTGNPLYKKTQELISNASEELRRVAHNMMPEVLLKVGLPEALRDMSNNISSGKILSVTFQSYGMEQRLSPATEIMLYRIVQELTNNIIKHSSATSAIIQLNRNNNQLSLTIEDNGKGFDTVEAAQKQSMGITTIKNRVEYLNGELSIDSQKNVGTTVMIDILLTEN